MMDPAIQLALRLAFALLLGAAAWHKLGDLGHFREVLRAHGILPQAATGVAAVLVPATEASIALALLVDLSAAGPAVLALMFVYAAVLQVNVARGRTDIDCGCMGPAARVPLGPSLVARNLVLAAAASLLLLPVSARGIGPADVLSATAATLALAACWLASERMLALAPRAARLKAQRRPR